MYIINDKLEYHKSLYNNEIILYSKYPNIPFLHILPIRGLTIIAELWGMIEAFGRLLGFFSVTMGFLSRLLYIRESSYPIVLKLLYVNGRHVWGYYYSQSKLCAIVDVEQHLMHFRKVLRRFPYGTTFAPFYLKDAGGLALPRKAWLKLV